MKRTLALASGATILVLTGCSGHPAQPVAGPSTAASTAVSTPAAPTPGLPNSGGPPGSAPAGSAPAGPSARPGVVTGCEGSALSLKQLPNGNGATGTIVVAISITNTSTTSCTLKGYPDFTLTGRTPGLTTDKPAPVSIKPGHLHGLVAYAHAPTQVTVAPGGTAGFLDAFSNVPQGKGECSAATRMNLKLGTSTATGPVQLAVCGAPMQVSPFVPASELSLD
jgi:hypothetical protein